MNQHYHHPVLSSFHCRNTHGIFLNHLQIHNHHNCSSAISHQPHPCLTRSSLAVSSLLPAVSLCRIILINPALQGKTQLLQTENELRKKNCSKGKSTGYEEEMRRK
jgi:hypothetical protein